MIKLCDLSNYWHSYGIYIKALTMIKMINLQRVIQAVWCKNNYRNYSSNNLRSRSPPSIFIYPSFYLQYVCLSDLFSIPFVLLSSCIFVYLIMEKKLTICFRKCFLKVIICGINRPIRINNGNDSHPTVFAQNFFFIKCLHCN